MPSCYRLTFKNNRAFEIVLEAGTVEGDSRNRVWVGTLYRVTNDAREHRPWCRTDGGPFQIVSIGESATLDLAKGVIRELIGAELDTVGPCGHRSQLPPLSH